MFPFSDVVSELTITNFCGPINFNFNCARDFFFNFISFSYCTSKHIFSKFVLILLINLSSVCLCHSVLNMRGPTVPLITVNGNIF